MVVPLRTGKVSAKSPGADMPFEGVSVAELTERMTREMVGRDGIEPPHIQRLWGREPADRVDDREPGPHRPFGIVFVRFWITKIDKHPVAHIFRD